MFENVIVEMDRLTENELTEYVRKITSDIKNEVDRFKIGYAYMKMNQLEEAYKYLGEFITKKAVNLLGILRYWKGTQSQVTGEWEFREIDDKPSGGGGSDDEWCCYCCCGLSTVCCVAYTVSNGFGETVQQVGECGESIGDCTEEMSDAWPLLCLCCLCA